MMRTSTLLTSILSLCAFFTTCVVQANNDNNNDEYGMFYFDASSMDFSDGAIYPKACISQ